MTRKLLFLFTILPSVLLAQHTIKGTFSPAKDFKFAFLYKVTAKTSVFINNASIKEDGTFEIPLDSAAVPGTYRIVYAQPQDEYNFDLLYNGKEDVALTFDLEKGLNFTKSSQNKLLSSYNKSMSIIGATINNYYAQNKKDEIGFKSVFKVLKDTQQEFETATEGMLANHFISAGKPYIPSEYEDIPTFSKHVKDNYFKHIDFGNKILQDSNFLIDATLNYVFGFISPDRKHKEFINNIDRLAEASKHYPEIQKTLLEVLWNQFAEAENETVANHIASRYLITLAFETKDQQLSKRIIAFKNTSIGKTAPDFKIELTDKKGQTTNKLLSALDNTTNYLVFFWSTTCSHCLEEIPKLKSYVTGIEDNRIQIIAIALDNDLYRWKTKIAEYPEFTHVFGEGKWDNEIGNNYNVGATPSYFLLNKDKKIIDKPYDFEAFKIFFEKILAETKKEQPMAYSSLLGSWTDSREENALHPNGLVFRPSDYKKFPVSRFRFKMILEDNGSCKFLSLSPTDRHEMVNGTWEYNATENTLKLFNTDHKTVKTYKVDKSKNDLLLLTTSN